MSMDLKVVPLDPDNKPHVGNMTEGIKSVIYDYVDGKNVTMAEVVGTLEYIKHEFMMKD